MRINNAENVPVNVVGSSKFGIWPKISLEKTYNMFISDGWMLSYAGYQRITPDAPIGKGRGLFRSIRGGFLIAVIGSGVYRISAGLGMQLVGNLDTSGNTEVIIDENLVNQICIVDGVLAYIYHYDGPSGTLTPQDLIVTPISSPAWTVIPNYVAYHNENFLIASAPTSPNNQSWYVFEANPADPTLIRPIAVGSINSISTKPDGAIAVRRVPGRGNNIIVFGSAVCEIWVNAPIPDVTGPPFVAGKAYQRVSSYNIDNGCISVSTISANDDVICWLAQNENNSVTIMTSNGSETKIISTDGIDHLLSSIKFPSQSTAFFFKQNGHLFYQFTFFNEADNLSLIYDFITGQFFHVSDESLNYHPARDVVFFDLESYFISLNDSSLYQIGDQFNTYNYTSVQGNPPQGPDDGETIPRIRICKTIHREDSSIFRVGYFTFWIEQGVNEYTTGNNAPRVDMSISKNGNQSFSNIVSNPLNTEGNYRNRINWYQLGQANEFTVQLRFWGLQRFVVNDGQVGIY